MRLSWNHNPNIIFIIIFSLFSSSVIVQTHIYKYFYDIFLDFFIIKINGLKAVLKNLLNLRLSEQKLVL